MKLPPIIADKIITEDKLARAKPENLQRLARFLKVDVTGCDHVSLAKLVSSYINSLSSRFCTPEKRSEYQKMWENL